MNNFTPEEAVVLLVQELNMSVTDMFRVDALSQYVTDRMPLLSDAQLRMAVAAVLRVSDLWSISSKCLKETSN